MYPHRIRLRGPWEITERDCTRKVMLPGKWSDVGDIVAGEVFTLSRNFGVPRVLDNDEHVWLTWSEVHVPVDLFINSRFLQSLGQQDRASSVEISVHLESRNTVSLRYSSVPPSASSLGEFALEIRGPVFVEQLAWDAIGRRLTGRISGQWRSNLELYVLANGRTVIHERIAHQFVGEAFDLGVPEPADGPVSRDFPAIRLELIDGGTCWWRADLPDEST